MTKKENPKNTKKNFEKLTFNLINWKENSLTWTPGVLRFKSAGTFPLGQMAKLMAVGFRFWFWVSFRAIVWGCLFVGFGYGQSYCGWLRFFCVLFAVW